VRGFGEPLSNSHQKSKRLAVTKRSRIKSFGLDRDGKGPQRQLTREPRLPYNADTTGKEKILGKGKRGGS